MSNSEYADLEGESSKTGDIDLESSDIDSKMDI
jgi:hypothetical protein